MAPLVRVGTNQLLLSCVTVCKLLNFFVPLMELTLAPLLRLLGGFTEMARLLLSVWGP